MVLFLALVREDSPLWTFVPGLFLIGAGIGVMLTSSVNVVQSSFPEADQGDISGLSRSLSNLGSSLGTSLAGSILVAAAFPGGRPFALALTSLVVISLIGLVLAALLRSPTSDPHAGRVAGTDRPLSRN
jgi:predicted MFS family arabinose efflux permease